jgi:hypothetical protein
MALARVADLLDESGHLLKELEAEVEIGYLKPRNFKT